jgi:type IV fimbrial biogenesis protein FimT
MLGPEEGRIVLNALPSQSGVTVIELAVGMTIVGILLALGMPSFSGYLQNARLGNAAKSFYTGVQTARAEAIQRNTLVEFIPTATPIDSNVVNSVAYSPTGQNWVVRVQDPAASSRLVDAKSAIEGSAGTASPIAVSTSGPALVFNGLGSSIAGAATVISISNPSAGLCAPLGPVKCWNVEVAPGGQAKLCDPSAASGVGDSRACTF